ncbi:hypothetical protein NA56DRAFT_665225 [Hyaloscypha hepaticicola]|uniref:Uncharacterized protein n=1 Tax=Hyaloscypha hepaticicola TaxID=2082293 RepID=A0A2J6PIA9_9HELO|nr:hypothetical protein NA56DRAFT_665225 [Hyaloscypha hepaticicola]
MSDRRRSMPRRQQGSDSMIGDVRSYEMRCGADAETDGDRGEGRDYLFAPLFWRSFKKDGVWGRSVRASFNGTGLSCDPYACGDAWVNGACSSLSDFRPMTYESLHSKFCGGSLCFVRARKRGNAMRALVLGGGLLAVMAPAADNCILHFQPGKGAAARKCASPLIGLLGPVDAQKSPMEEPKLPNVL